MNKQWQEYCAKYLVITPREQYMVMITGLIVIIFSMHALFVDENAIKIDKIEKKVRQLSTENRSSKASITVFEEALSKDPNIGFNRQISQYKEKLAKVDVNLLKLTSDLIDPVQMRYALLKLLKTQKGVSLQSFQVIAAEPLTMSSSGATDKNGGNKTAKDDLVQEKMVLYRHAIKIKINGGYFQLRDYLTQLEALSWKFYWKEFNYQLKEYPKSELEIEMYSLSTKREFIGV